MYAKGFAWVVTRLKLRNLLTPFFRFSLPKSHHFQRVSSSLLLLAFPSWLLLLSITMTSLSLRSMALRRLIHQSGKAKNEFRAGSSDSSFTGALASLRFMSTNVTPLTEREQAFQAKGFLDDRGLTVFDTLHEMQVRSCQVFADRELFGTYSKESKKFEWMTYQEFDDQVNKCRAVLKDIGTSWEDARVLFMKP
jgi:hypothetical protein